MKELRAVLMAIHNTGDGHGCAAAAAYYFCVGALRVWDNIFLLSTPDNITLVGLAIETHDIRK
jgi:hypothetical protein